MAVSKQNLINDYQPLNADYFSILEEIQTDDNQHTETEDAT